jgi:hypothetical protein
MDAILATIADGGQAMVHIDREASRNTLIICLIYNLILNPSKETSPNPFCRGSGVRYVHPSKPCRGSGKQLIMVGMFVSCVFCYQKAF